MNLTRDFEKSGRWTPEAAQAWYRNQPWHKGFNYLPSYAINQIEMWQADTFDPDVIEKDMACAQEAGMTTVRVFLHDLLWDQDAAGFKERVDTFLSICARHEIQPVVTLFDSCWDPLPHLGKQRDPLPRVHNSGWVQSPGAVKLRDEASYPGLEAYVKDVVGTFAQDPRILLWDVWNEPDNMNDSSYGRDGLNIELPQAEKERLVRALLPRVFDWVRAAAAAAFDQRCLEMEH